MSPSASPAPPASKLADKNRRRESGDWDMFFAFADEAFPSGEASATVSIPTLLAFGGQANLTARLILSADFAEGRR